MEESQVSLFGVILFWGVIIVYQITKRLIKGNREERLRKLVNWCVNGRLGDRECPLIHYINSVELISDTPKYKVTTDSELKDANTLFDLYKQDLQKTYLSKNFSSTMIKLITKMSELDFFMLTLNSFLHDTFMDIHCENTIYREISRKNYGMWGGQLFDAECELTDFGIVYQKLLYITHAYCEKSLVLNSNNIFYGADKYKDSIDTRIISISRI